MTIKPMPGLTALKPDTLNGSPVLRPVTHGRDGLPRIRPGVVFPPRVDVKAPAVVTLAELVEQALNTIITVSDQTADPVIKAQAVAFKAKLKQALMHWMARSALNERECVRQFLISNGFQQAAEALGGPNG